MKFLGWPHELTTTHLTHTSHTGFLLYSIVLFRLQYRPVIPPMTVRPRIINVVRVPLASTITTTISHYAVCVRAARVSFKQIEITGMFRALDASVNSRPTSVDTSKFQAQNISYRYACSVLTGRVMCASRCQHSASTRTNIEIKL